MAPTDRSARTCQTTGLRLIPARGQKGFRVTRTSRAALDPPLRGPVGHPVASWGRFDTFSGRTVYIGESKRATYCEVLSYQTPDVGMRSTKLSAVFDDVAGSDPDSLYDAIAREWDQQYKITPDRIVMGWRTARWIHHLTLPTNGWLVDISHADTIRALNKQLATRLNKVGIGRLTLAHLTGEMRDVTVLVASWVRSLALDDGSEPHGIQYTSKHGQQGSCWAVWLRRVDDVGADASSEPTKCLGSTAIPAPDRDPDLKWAADTMGVRLLG